MKKWIFVFGVAVRGMCGQMDPWLTGSLIAPVGEVVPYGDFLVRSYLYGGAEVGRYDANWNTVDRSNIWNVSAQFQWFFGITPTCDISIFPTVVYNRSSDEHVAHFGDLTVGLDVQLMQADRTPYFPGIKFAVREVFPTGKYQNFQPKKAEIDGSGFGTFATQFALVFYKVYHLSSLHYLSMTYSAQATIHTPVHVHGFNAYGGGFGTRGRVQPGNEYQGIASFELTLDRHWALALDNVYVYRERSPFWGSSGISFNGTFMGTGLDSSETFSMAPAIEYNFDKNLGIIFGCWLSVCGRNSAEFRTGVLNVQYAY